MTDNPFQAPVDDRDEAHTGEYKIRRQGDGLILEDRVELPKGCVFCNAEAHRSVDVKLRSNRFWAWFSRDWYWRLWICKHHNKVLWRLRLLRIALIPLYFSVLFLVQDAYLILPLCAVVVVVLVIAAWISPALRIKRAYDNEALVKGFGEKYLDRFPKGDV